MADEHGTIREPDNATVDDWMGQTVSDDEAKADEAVEQAGGDMAKAEEIFEREADGKERHEAGYPRP